MDTRNRSNLYSIQLTTDEIAGDIQQAFFEIDAFNKGAASFLFFVVTLKKLVDEIIAAKTATPDTDVISLENEIDRVVYSLRNKSFWDWLN